MKFRINDYFTQENIGVLFLMVPMLSKWLLPPGLETKLYYEPFNLFNLYIPNTLLLFSPAFFRNSRYSNVWSKGLFWLWFILEIVVVLSSETPNFIMNLCSNTFFFGALYLGLFHRLSSKHISLLKPLCILGIIVIALQLIVLSTGLWSYDLGDIGSEFGGVFRVYTTAGEANASGTTIAVLMFFLLLTIRNSMAKLIIVIVSVIAIFFTVSRGPIALIILAFMYIWLKYFRKRIKYNILFCSVIAVLAYIGIFNPIIDRVNQKNADGDITSGRDVLIETVINDVDKNGAELWGLGVGNVYQSTEVIYSDVKMPNSGAPHNSYVLLYAEQGIIGIILFSLLLIAYISKSYCHNKDACVFLFLILLITYNTETVFCVNSDYVFLVALLMMLINSDIKYKIVKQ